MVLRQKKNDWLFVYKKQGILSKLNLQSFCKIVWLILDNSVFFQ